MTEIYAIEIRIGCRRSFFDTAQNESKYKICSIHKSEIKYAHKIQRV
jgi:hypothetical protein